MKTSATCPVHGLPLALRRTPIAYGYPDFRPDYEDARRTRFPFGGEPPLGGCLVPRERETAEVEVCDRCAQERRAWWDAHGRP